MPIGTPEEYAAARQAEIAGVELDHGPHREHDYHEFLDSVCAQAVELSAIADATPGLPESMAKVERDVLAWQRRKESLSRFARRFGMFILTEACWSVGYNLKEDRWADQPADEPALPW